MKNLLTVLCIIGALGTVQGQTPDTSIQLDFEGSVRNLAITLHEDGGNEDTEHLKAGILKILSEEWTSFQDRDRTADETFGGQTYLERFMATFQELAPEPQETLAQAFYNNLLDMIGRNEPEGNGGGLESSSSDNQNEIGRWYRAREIIGPLTGEEEIIWSLSFTPFI